MRKSLGIYLAGVFSAILLLAVPALAAKDTVVIDLSNETATCDPHMQWNQNSYGVYRNIFDNLITRDNKGMIIPAVASSWKSLNDTQIEFVIRTDITFHDGAPLTPADVVYSIERITDKATASPQRSQFEAVIKAEVTGPDRVVFTTAKPYPPLLAQLVKLSIVPKAYVEKVGKEAFNKAPIGSGPYKFVAWKRGVHILLERNEAYWGNKGFFPKAEFRFVPDPGTRVADLRTGKADLAVDLNPDLAAVIEKDAVCEPRVTLTERVAFLRTNNGRAPTSNKHIRQAIAYGIDKQGIIDGLMNGQDRIAHTMLTKEMAGYSELSGYPYDPEKARALVAQAGDAAKEELVFATAPSYDQRIVQAVQQMLSDIGLRVRIAMMDQASFLKAVQQGDLAARPHISFGRWSCACMDADGVVYPLLHSGSAWSQTRNADLDGLLDEARICLDPEKRVELYAKADKIILDESYILPLYQVAYIYGANKHLVWTPTPDESLFLNRMRWK